MDWKEGDALVLKKESKIFNYRDGTTADIGDEYIVKNIEIERLHILEVVSDHIFIIDKKEAIDIFTNKEGRNRKINKIING